MPSDERPPIFVVGCQRSGTTMLRLILDSHPNISCGPETRFLETLAAVTTQDWGRLRRYGLTEEEWYGRVADFFGGILGDYARARGKVRWADKTPRYALQLDFIDKVFPTCQIVHVIRDGREVVLSHRKRWGLRSAGKAIIKWPRYIAAARGLGRRLPPGRYHEVRYEDLVTRTEPALRELMTFLGEPWSEALLHYDRFEHDVPDTHGALTAARRRSAGTSETIYSSRVGAFRTELNPLLRLAAWVRFRPTLRDLGYL